MPLLSNDHMQRGMRMSTWFENLQSEVQKLEDDDARQRARILTRSTCNCGAIATISSPDYEQRMVRTHHEVWCKSNDVHR
jgi:hypothetical protein